MKHIQSSPNRAKAFDTLLHWLGSRNREDIYQHVGGREEREGVRAIYFLRRYASCKDCHGASRPAVSQVHLKTLLQ